MDRPPTHEDARLVLRVQRLLQEATLQKARAWLLASCTATTMEEFDRLAPWGSEANAFARQGASFWDMAASLVTHGIVHREFFLESLPELPAVWQRIAPIVAPARALSKDVTLFRNLERAATAHGAWARHAEGRRADYADAQLLLDLYDARRTPALRAARDWALHRCRACAPADFAAMCPPGSDEEAKLHTVLDYWQMVAAMVTTGVLDERIFYENTREVLFIWEKIKDLAPVLRDRNPAGWRNHERLARSFRAWLDVESPGAYELWAERVRQTGQPVAPN